MANGFTLMAIGAYIREIIKEVGIIQDNFVRTS